MVKTSLYFFNKTKQQFICCFVLLNLFFLQSCKQSSNVNADSTKYKGSSIIMKYRPDDQFQHGDYISINKIVFKADSLYGLNNKKSNSSLVYIPSSRYVYHEGGSKNIYENISVFGCMQILGESLIRYGDTSSIRVNMRPLIFSGEIEINSINNTKLEVETNRGFPLQIIVK